LRGHDGFFLRRSIVQDLLIGRTLYHEVGHHIHRTRHPEYKDREAVANEWRDRLMGCHMRRRYWYLRIPMFFLRPVMPLMDRRLDKMEHEARVAQQQGRT
jgi:hypothetical protein